MCGVCNRETIIARVQIALRIIVAVKIRQYSAALNIRILVSIFFTEIRVDTEACIFQLLFLSVMRSSEVAPYRSNFPLVELSYVTATQASYGLDTLITFNYRPGK